jgi:hypothetical protein
MTIEQQMLEIKVDNGYNTDVGNNVWVDERGCPDIEEGADIPPGVTLMEESMEFPERTGVYKIKVVGVVRIHDDINRTREPARLLINDIKLAVRRGLISSSKPPNKLPPGMMVARVASATIPERETGSLYLDPEVFIEINYKHETVL